MITDKNEIDMQITYIRGNLIIKNYNHCSEDVKMELCKSYCCSIYCCALVSVCHKTVLDKLPVACNNVFKSLMLVLRDFGASALFASLNVCNYATLRCKLVYSFINCIRSSSGSLTGTLVNSVHFEKAEKRMEQSFTNIIWALWQWSPCITNYFLWNMSNNKAYLILFDTEFFVICNVLYS